MSLFTRRNFTLILASALLVIAGIACGGLTGGNGGGGTTQSFAGSYDVTGTNPDGSNYFGSVIITSTGGSNYSVAYTIDTTPVQVINGDGVLNAGGQLVVTDDSGITTTLTLLPNGNLTGSWTTDGTDTGTEELTRK